jgi:hypothetical protein
MESITVKYHTGISSALFDTRLPQPIRVVELIKNQTMSRLILQLILGLISVSAFSQSATLAERSRQRIISDLVFTYVQNPKLPASNVNSSSILNKADRGANR